MSVSFTFSAEGILSLTEAHKKLLNTPLTEIKKWYAIYIKCVIKQWAVTGTKRSWSDQKAVYENIIDWNKKEIEESGRKMYASALQNYK